ncbi:MAG: phosphosulfolactate synthase [Rhodothermales bacterium]
MIGIPDRPAKPRESGMTLLLDKGLAPRQVEDVLDVAAEYVDLVKLGWGTAAITPGLERKLDVYRSAGIPAYFGGTLFEAFFLRDQLDAYRKLLRSLRLEHVEISDGTLHIVHEEKLSYIRSFAEDFSVLSEVGSKDRERIMPPYKWVRLIEAELEAGSWKVICEARESGTAGLYRPNGEVRTGLVEEIVDLIDRDRLIFEAPKKPQQVWFIQHLGTNVNLGNIGPEEIIPLETLRLGLRSDTLFEFFSSPDLASLGVNSHTTTDDEPGES